MSSKDMMHVSGRTASTTEALYQKSLGSFSLRTKIILTTILSLLISIPIATLLNSVIHRFTGTLSFGVYVNTIVSLIVTTALITMFVQLVAIRPLKLVAKTLQEMTAGNLNSMVKYHSKDEIGVVASELNKMGADLRAMMNELNGSSERLAAAAMELSASADENTRASEQIATTVQQTSAGMAQQEKTIERSSNIFEQISRQIDHIVDSVTESGEAATKTLEVAGRGSQAIQQAIQQMNQIQLSVNDLSNTITTLHKSSGEIGKITETITEISSQTNLLALNAAIEAARAGEHGRGFSVVAREVRKLAEQSSVSATQITDLINSIQSETQSATRSTEHSTREVSIGLETVEQAHVAFSDVQNSVVSLSRQLDGVIDLTSEISSGTKTLQTSIEEVLGVSRMATSGSGTAAVATQEQLVSMQEIGSSSSDLTSMAETLQHMIQRFEYA